MMLRVLYKHAILGLPLSFNSGLQLWASITLIVAQAMWTAERRSEIALIGCTLDCRGSPNETV